MEVLSSVVTDLIFRSLHQIIEERIKSVLLKARRSSLASPELYRAALLGNLDEILIFTDQLYTLRVEGGDTVLHVIAGMSGQSSNSAVAVKLVLEKEPRLLLTKNGELETALHVAASTGHSDVVEVIIEFAKKTEDSAICGSGKLKDLLGARDREGNTALHEAVGNNFYEAAKLLVEADTDLRYKPNFAGESPLYRAVVNENHGIALLILSHFQPPSYDGPGGRSALHAAALCKFPEFKDVVELILEKLPQATEKVDEYGWTALHYVAKFNCHEVASQLVSKDMTMAYISASSDDGSKAALHIAVIHGSLGVIREILNYTSNCWVMATDERQNILHLAVKHEQGEVLEFILCCPWSGRLVNRKDINGNTPLHLYVETEKLEGQNLVNHSCVNRNTINKAGLTPLGLIMETHQLTDRQKEIKGQLEQAGVNPRTGNIGRVIAKVRVLDKDMAERIIKISDSYMIVAALIVTVTFAAGFTVPGGFESGDGQNKGMAVLVKKAAFSIFIIADSTALLLAMLVVLRQLIVHHRPDLFRDPNGLFSSEACIGYSMIAMVIAFMSGLFAVVPTRDIKIYLCVIISVFGYYSVGNFIEWRYVITIEFLLCHGSLSPYIGELYMGVMLEVWPT